MPKTNWQDPGSTEMRSTQISGLQEAVGKIEESIGISGTAETGILLSEVFISNEDRLRIFQAPLGKRNWLLSPAPIIKKNGVTITEGFEIDYGGGAIIQSVSALGTDVFTADASFTTKLSTSIADDLSGLKYLANTGTANAIVVNKSGFTLANGNYIEWQQTEPNTTAPTMNATDTGAKELKATDGSVLASGDLVGFCKAIYDATNDFFVLAPKGGAKINSIIAEYELDSGQNISAGDLVEFIKNKAKIALPTAKVISGHVTYKSGTITGISAMLIDANTILVTFIDSSNSSYGTAIVLTINDTTITAGTPTVFESTSLNWLTSTLIDTNKVLVAYSGSNNSGYGTARVLTISGTTITAGTPTVFASESITSAPMSSVLIDVNKVLVTYQGPGASYYAKAIVLTVSGTTISSGTPYVGGETQRIYEVALISNNKVLAYYRGSSNYGTAVVLTINDTTITAGTPLVYLSATVTYPSVKMIDTNKMLVVYQNNGDSKYGTAIVLTINDTTITAGTPTVFNSAETNYISLEKIITNKCLVSYTNAGNLNCSTASVLLVNDTTIIAGNPEIMVPYTTLENDLVLVDTNKLILSYRGNGSKVVLIETLKYANGLAIQNGTAGETKKFYDWR